MTNQNTVCRDGKQLIACDSEWVYGEEIGEVVVEMRSQMRDGELLEKNWALIHEYDFSIRNIKVYTYTLFSWWNVLVLLKMVVINGFLSFLWAAMGIERTNDSFRKHKTYSLLFYLSHWDWHFDNAQTNGMEGTRSIFKHVFTNTRVHVDTR